MKFGTIYLFGRVVVDFFAWEAIWGASSMLRAIYYSRFALMSVPVFSALIFIHTLSAWPRGMTPHNDGEEGIVLQGEFKAVQQRNREIQSGLQADQDKLEDAVQSVKLRLSSLEETERRIEDKLNLGMKVLWSICGLLIVRVVLPLLKMGLRTELSRLAKEPE